MPIAAMTAPARPATGKPMNATVMTTGPGVIIATATASRNWCSFSQPNCCTTPCCKNGTIARPPPNTKAPALVKNKRICQFGLGPGGHYREHGENSPQQGIAFVSAAGQLVSSDGNDGDDHCADP